MSGRILSALLKFLFKTNHTLKALKLRSMCITNYIDLIILLLFLSKLQSTNFTLLYMAPMSQHWEQRPHLALVQGAPTCPAGGAGPRMQMPRAGASASHPYPQGTYWPGRAPGDEWLWTKCNKLKESKFHLDIKQKKIKKKKKSNIFMTKGQVGRGNIACGGCHVHLQRFKTKQKKAGSSWVWSQSWDLGFERGLDETPLKSLPTWTTLISQFSSNRQDQDLIFNLISIKQEYTYKEGHSSVSQEQSSFQKHLKWTWNISFYIISFFFFFCQVVETFSGHLPNIVKHNSQASFI